MKQVLAGFATLAAILMCLCGSYAIPANEKTGNQTIAQSYAALRQHNYDKAIQLLQDGLKQFPDDRRLKVQLGRAYLYARKDDRAIRLFNEVLREEPSNREAKLELARALGYHRDYTSSDVLYRELLKANPNDEAAAQGLVRNLMEEKRTTEARRELKDALARHPNNLRLQEYKKRLDQKSATTKAEQRGEKKRYLIEDGESYFTDSAGNRSLRSSQQMDAVIVSGLSNRVRLEERSLWQSSGPRANVYYGTDELRLRLNGFTRIGLGAGGVHFADGRGSALYRGELELHPAPRLWLTGGFSRVPVFPTFKSSQFDLTAEGWDARLDWDPRHWRSNFIWSKQHYSDGNRVHRESAELLRWIGGSGLAFGAGYQFAHISFTQPSLRHGYFDPSHYQSHLGIGAIRFGLGKTFHGEYQVRVGGEQIAAQSFQPAWEAILKNRFLLDNWEVGADYLYYHLAQSSGAFSAHAPRFVVRYHF